MHVALFVDMEGAFGIWRMRQCRTGTAEWQYGRQCLTRDVNSVVAGAFAGGAGRVTVKDIHDSGFNCIVPRLDERVRYIGGHRPSPTFFGSVSNYDLILYVAIHAGAGTEGAFFPHTHLGVFSEFLVNDKPVGEMDIYGSYLGEFGVPIGFVSGEDVAVAQAEAALPWVESVAVDKRKEMYTAGDESRAYIEKGQQQLLDTAAEAVRNSAAMKPLVNSGPLRFQTTFRKKSLADRYNTWGFEQDGAVVRWKGDNMIEGFDLLNKLTFFPKKTYRFRHLIMFLYRNYCRVRHGYFAPRPNPEGAWVGEM